MATQRVLVLGASGFIGSNICAHLGCREHWAVDGRSTATCNLLEPEPIARALESHGPGASVVFCSAVGRLIEDSWSSMQKNLAMVHNFVRAVPPGGLGSVVFLSSSDVYGMPPPELPIRESTPPRPSSHYGLSKYASERILSFSLPESVPLAILRLPGVYGKGDRGMSAVGRIAEKIRSRRPVTITNGGKTLRDFVAVEDVCAAVKRLIEQRTSGLFNAATGKSTSMAEVLELVSRALGVAPRVRFTPERGQRDHDLVFSPELFFEACPGLRVKTLEEGVSAYLSRPASAP